MGQFFFDPNDYAVGTGFSDLPFTQITGDPPSQFEIVEVDGQHVLQIVTDSGTARRFLFNGAPESKSDTEVFQRAELLNYTELRYYKLLRATTGNNRLRTTMEGNSDGPPDTGRILIVDADENVNQLDNWTFGSSPQWPISWLESLQGTTLVMTLWDDTSSQESPVETRTTTDNDLDSGTVAGRPGFGLGRAGTMNLYFLGVGDEGDAAPQESLSDEDGEITFTGANAVRFADDDTAASDATVVAVRKGVEATPVQTVTDSNGEATLTGLASGEWRTWAEKEVSGDIKTTQVIIRTVT